MLGLRLPEKCQDETPEVQMFGYKLRRLLPMCLLLVGAFPLVPDTARANSVGDCQMRARSYATMESGRSNPSTLPERIVGGVLFGHKKDKSDTSDSENNGTNRLDYQTLYDSYFHRCMRGEVD